jgi:hypothetical protein
MIGIIYYYHLKIVLVLLTKFEKLPEQNFSSSRAQAGGTKVFGQASPRSALDSEYPALETWCQQLARRVPNPAERTSSKVRKRWLCNRARGSTWPVAYLPPKDVRRAQKLINSIPQACLEKNAQICGIRCNFGRTLSWTPFRKNGTWWEWTRGLEK